MNKRFLRALLCGALIGAVLLPACAGGQPGSAAGASRQPSSAASEQRGWGLGPSSAGSEVPEPPVGNQTNNGSQEVNTEMKITVQAGTATFTATLEENEAANALAELLGRGPVTIQMSDYAGFEKVGALGTSLPASDAQTTTRPGDIVLYQGDRIVLFYGSNTWRYTRLGKIDDLTGWAEALGGGDVPVTFSMEG